MKDYFQRSADCKKHDHFLGKKDHSGETLDNTMKHLILRLSKKDEHFLDKKDHNSETFDNTMKHLILRLSKKDFYFPGKEGQRGEKLDSTMKHLILRLSKKGGILQDKKNNKGQKFGNTMQHLLLRTSKKDSVVMDKKNDDKLDNTMHHLILRLSKKDGALPDNPDSKRQQLENTMKHLILRLSKKDNVLSPEQKDSQSHEHDIPQEGEEEYRNQLAENKLLRLFFQVYPPINSNPNKIDDYGKRSDNQNNNSAVIQNRFSTHIGSRMWDKRFSKTDDIYRLLRTLRRYPEITEDDEILNEKVKIPSKKVKQVLVRMV